MNRLFYLLALLLLLPIAGARSGEADVPKVVLIGDSIRIGYAPLVAKKLAGKAVVISFKENGGDSGNVLKHLDAWVIKQKPALVHLNAGLHDLKLSQKTKKYQVDVEQYQANLKKIVERIRTDTKAKLIFALTTPILDDRHAKRKAAFDRFEADVVKYNEAARQVMKEAKVAVNDLHSVVAKGGPSKLLGKDGTHYTTEGNELLAEAVASTILRELKAK